MSPTEPYVHTITMSNVNMDMRIIRKEQREDNTLGYWVHLLTNSEKPCKNDFPNTRKQFTLYRWFHNLHMVRGVLYRMVCMDYLILVPTKGGITNVLVITDHFTRVTVAIPTKDQTAKTTAEAFFNGFVAHYVLPAKIHTDQGANFQSELFSHLCLLTGMEKSRTSPYHHMGNGLTGRFNRILISMFRTNSSNQNLEWKKHIAPLVHAYNCMRHEST